MVCGIRPRVSRHAEGGNFVVEAMADIVIGVHDLTSVPLVRAPGFWTAINTRLRIPLGGKARPGKVIALATSGQKYEYKTG
jgi:hypothetical protein